MNVVRTVGALAAVGCVAVVLGTSRGGDQTGGGVPASAQVATTPGLRTGAIFTGEPTSHSCTGEVIDSPSGTLVLTAAHCVADPPTAMSFAPGWDGDASAAGVWRVKAAYVSQAWSRKQAPSDDVAVLVIARRGGNGPTIESVTGGYGLTSGLAVGTRVHVPAYPQGQDSQVHCGGEITELRSGVFPRFECAGYTSGVSGAPFLVRGRGGQLELAAVLGGYQQGGCEDDASYGVPVGPGVQALVRAAESGATPQPIPPAPNDC